MSILFNLPDSGFSRSNTAHNDLISSVDCVTAPKKTWTPYDDAVLLAAIREGKPFEEVAKQFGCTDRQVEHRLKKLQNEAAVVAS